MKHAAIGLALLALFLVLANDSPLDVKNTAQASGHNNHAADHKNEPDPPMALKEPEKDNRQKGDSVAKESHGNASKNSLDYLFWVLVVNTGLFLVTLVIAVAGLIQAIAARRNAIAAGLNAQAVIEAQRPHIAIGTHGSPINDLLSATPRVQVELANRGAIPAHGCRYESWIELLPFPFRDFTTAADYCEPSEPFSLYAGQPIMINIPFQKGWTDADRTDARTQRRFVSIRVRVVYRDPFAKKGNVTVNCGVYVLKEGFAFLPRYNDRSEDSD